MPAYYVPERLQAKISGVRTCKVSTLVAPAGYGKTSAVHSLGLDGLVEMRLDARCSTVAAVWDLLVQEAAACPPLHELLADMPAPRDLTGLQTLLQSLRHDKLGSGSPIYLFVDNAHYALRAGGLSDLLDAVEALPSNVHLVLASRKGILTLTDRMKLGHDLLEIGVSDLRLTQGEIAEFAASEGVDLKKNDACRLFRQTEGWIGCLQGILLEYRQTGVPMDCELHAAGMVSELFPPCSIDERLAVLSVAETFDAVLASRLWSALAQADACANEGGEAQEREEADEHAESGTRHAGRQTQPHAAWRSRAAETMRADAALRAYESEIGFIEHMPMGGGSAAYRFHRAFRLCAAARFDELSLQKQQRAREVYAAWHVPEGAPVFACSAESLNGRLDEDLPRGGEEGASSASAGQAAAEQAFSRRAPEPDDLQSEAFTLLTPRERKMVSLAVRRYTNAEIAEQLNLSEGVVKLYFNRIYAKLDIGGSVRGKRHALERLVAIETS